MPVKPMCSASRRTTAGPALTPEQLHLICDRLMKLAIRLRELDDRIAAMEVREDALAVAA